jgi:hypothetical protein
VRVDCSDEFTVYLQELQRSAGNVTETIPEDVLAYIPWGFRSLRVDMLKMG